MPRDLTNPSREGKAFVRSILATYVKGMINDGDYERLEREILDVIRAERRIVIRWNIDRLRAALAEAKDDAPGHCENCRAAVALTTVHLCATCLPAAPSEHRAALAEAGRSSLPDGWQPIETAPKMRTVLLFAVTEVDEHGTVKNWRMETGFWHTGYEDARSRAEGFSPWCWEGHQLKVYEPQPTHWWQLPASLPLRAGEPQ